jgi:hypothetical protein
MRRKRFAISVPDQRAGEVVLANCMHPFEDPRSTGKVRPMILDHRDGGQWMAMGLTTNPAYRTGQPRMPIPNPAALGLIGQGYFWGPRLTRISALDLYFHIGWATEEVLKLIERLQALGGDIR